MKRTDLERRERELKRVEKRDRLADKRSSEKPETTVGTYIENLFSLFRYDAQEIFNVSDDIKILELLEEMKEEQPEKQWENIIKKAIKKTKIASKDKALTELISLMS